MQRNNYLRNDSEPHQRDPSVAVFEGTFAATSKIWTVYPLDGSGTRLEAPGCWDDKV